MEKVTLIFESEVQLRAYLQVAKANFLHINVKHKTVACDCSKEEIELAMKHYGAKVAEHGNVFQ